MEWLIFVHAGAWDIPRSHQQRHVAAVYRAAIRAGRILHDGGTALDAVVAAVADLEDTPGINAGRGSACTRDGNVEMDAAVMRGDNLAMGSVGGVRHVKNPVRLARLVMEKSPHAFLVGAGAEQAARAWGLEMRPMAYFLDTGGTPAVPGGGDTVGAIARDARGCLAVATSTGGTPGKWSGRVGDTPLPGCGFYALDPVGAAVCSGFGEAIMRMVLAYRAVAAVQAGSHPQVAAERVLGELYRRTRRRAGLLVVGRQGEWGCAFHTAHFPRALWLSAWRQPRVWLAHAEVEVEDRSTG